MRKKDKSFSRERWLELALEAMENECISKFSLDSLIKAMPVTKGSFYSHFKNRTDFLLALVEFWERHHTRTVVAAIDALPECSSAQDKLWELISVVYDMDFNRDELIIRSLSLEFPQIRDSIKRVDDLRLKTVGQLFADMGFTGDELETRTRSFVVVNSQDKMVLSDISPEDYERHLRLRFEFFTRP